MLVSLRPLGVTFALTGAAVAQLALYAPRLPARVPSTYDMAGNPVSWMDATSFVVVYVAIVALVLAIFTFGSPLLRRVPDHQVNLPNREYWLAPERREASIDALIAWMRWYGAATLAFVIALYQGLFESNVSGGEVGPLPWIAGAAYLAATLFMVIWLLRRFGRAATRR